jgi:hypothetical protein
MKFLSLAQVFAAFAAVAASPQKSNLRKLSVDEPSAFLEAKPASEACEVSSLPI